MIGGFDMEPSSDHLRDARERSRRLLAGRGVEPRFVETNQRAWGKQFAVNRPFLYSGHLAAAGLLFGPSRLLIASAYPYGHSPTDGSEPYLDPLWSNGRTQVEQIGSEAWRSEKIRVIADHPDLLAELRVCFYNQNQNCGKCPKCIRTMVTLRVLGQQGPFPRVMTLAEIRRLPLTEHELHFAIDCVLIAAEVGATDELRALKAAIARFDRKQVLVQLDRWLLGGWLRKRRRQRRMYEDGPAIRTAARSGTLRLRRRMRLEPARLTTNGDRIRVEATLTSATRSDVIWFELDSKWRDQVVVDRLDAFSVTALMVAMERGDPLEICLSRNVCCTTSRIR